MFMDELEKLDKLEQRRLDPREDRKLLPIDSYSQSDTGYTGRPDGDMQKQEKRDTKSKRVFLA